VAASASTEPHPSARPPADGDGDPPPPPPRGAHATTSRRPRRRRGGAARTRGRMDGTSTESSACVRGGGGSPGPTATAFPFPALRPRASGRRSRAPRLKRRCRRRVGVGSLHHTTPHHTTPHRGGGMDARRRFAGSERVVASHPPSPRTTTKLPRKEKLPRACRSEKKPGAAARAARQRHSPAGCVRAWNDGDGRAPLGGNQSKVFVSTWSPCSFLLVYHRVLCLSLAFACFSPFFFPFFLPSDLFSSSFILGYY
jgi:hypothetical protein